MARVKFSNEEVKDSESFTGYMASSEEFEMENYRLSMNERGNAYAANRIPAMDIGQDKEQSNIGRQKSLTLYQK